LLIPKPLGGAVRGSLRAIANRYTPLQVQLVVTRRCNLSCGYCNEYDDFSPPTPYEDLRQYVDHLADLGTVVLTLTGGEPLLNPRLDDVCAYAVSKGIVVTSITNGYPVNRTWIERLNKARLTLMQVSVDNLQPNEWSQKSWSRLKKKLELLRDHAEFSVNVNAVLGACSADETRTLVKEVREMGFYQTVGLMHDGMGKIISGLVADDALPAFHDEITRMSRKSLFHHFGEGWETRMLTEGIAPWKCRAGARYLYVDEDGIVSTCSQRRGKPGISLLDYDHERLVYEWHLPKGCDQRCTIGCVRRASSIDEWRAQDGEPWDNIPRGGRSNDVRPHVHEAESDRMLISISVGEDES
jgi:MoaA/NifB/PqqE/SkfB family radical SAM enzyme